MICNSSSEIEPFSPRSNLPWESRIIDTIAVGDQTATPTTDIQERIPVDLARIIGRCSAPSSGRRPMARWRRSTSARDRTRSR
jgi:hypothetical protein